jgi:hypothetical protein
MINENDKSGHRDSDGNWVDETPQAKLRNKLSPFWTLTDILGNDKYFDKIMQDPNGIEMIRDLAKRCNVNKKIILDLISETE